MREPLRFDGSKALITLSAMLASLMAFIDISIVTVGLSEIRASLGTPLNQISWVSTSYMVGNVLIMPLTGWLQRRFGFRRCFTVSVLMFTLASALCGCAWNLPSLVACRMLQGLGGGAIIPTAQAILFVRYPRSQHGRVSGLVGLAAVTGPLLGPYLGGVIVDQASWHWMFFINIPIGLLAALLSHRHLREAGWRGEQLGVDRWGLLLLVIGLPSLQFVLEEGNREGWFESTLIIVLLVASVIALLTFTVHELETRNPLINLRLFANSGYAAATGINLLTGAAIFSGSFCFSLFCGIVLEYSPINIGLVFLRGNALLIVLMPLMGTLVGRVNGRWLIGAGVLLIVASLWLNGQLTPAADMQRLVTPLVVRAFGMALVFVPLMPFALSEVPPEQRGNAAAMFNLSRELGGSIGTAWMTTALDNGVKRHGAWLSQYVDGLSSVSAFELAQMREYVRQSGLSWQPELTALVLAQLRVLKQALALAFNDDFRLLAAAIALALGCVLFLPRDTGGAAPEAGH